MKPSKLIDKIARITVKFAMYESRDSCLKFLRVENIIKNITPTNEKIVLCLQNRPPVLSHTKSLIYSPKYLKYEIQDVIWQPNTHISTNFLIL